MIDNPLLIRVDSDRWQCNQFDSNGVKRNEAQGHLVQLFMSKVDVFQQQFVVTTNLGETVIVVDGTGGSKMGSPTSRSIFAKYSSWA